VILSGCSCNQPLLLRSGLNCFSVLSTTTN